MNSRAAPILVYGGTFDPPHYGHVEPCSAVADALGTQRIIVIPARISPTKTEMPAPAVHRVAMLKLAFASEPRSLISTQELDRPGPSYFVETARSLRNEHGPGADLRFLIGADNALSFRKWREWETILELIRPVVVVRPPLNNAALDTALREYWGSGTERGADPGADPKANPGVEANLWLEARIEAPEVNVNATELRSLLARGDDPTPFVGASVARYIADHQLYCESAGS